MSWIKIENWWYLGFSMICSRTDLFRACDFHMDDSLHWENIEIKDICLCLYTYHKTISDWLTCRVSKRQDRLHHAFSAPCEELVDLHSHHITSHHITSHQINITSCHITSHHIDITSQCHQHQQSISISILTRLKIDQPITTSTININIKFSYVSYRSHGHTQKL